MVCHGYVNIIRLAQLCWSMWRWFKSPPLNLGESAYIESFSSHSEGLPVLDDTNSVAESESVKATSSLCLGEEDLGVEDSPVEEQSGKSLITASRLWFIHTTRRNFYINAHN